MSGESTALIRCSLVSCRTVEIGQYSTWGCRSRSSVSRRSSSFGLERILSATRTTISTELNKKVANFGFQVPIAPRFVAAGKSWSLRAARGTGPQAEINIPTPRLQKPHVNTQALAQSSTALCPFRYYGNRVEIRELFPLAFIFVYSRIQRITAASIHPHSSLELALKMRHIEMPQTQCLPFADLASQQAQSPQSVTPGRSIKRSRLISYTPHTPTR
ncbi:hypothetical protein PM082_007345 [Marasmius tenuissimus]|nr:hypothetical protein PM082_007345 [Marasmius tenuissimus]